MALENSHVQSYKMFGCHLVLGMIIYIYIIILDYQRVIAGHYLVCFIFSMAKTWLSMAHNYRRMSRWKVRPEISHTARRDAHLRCQRVEAWGLGHPFGESVVGPGHGRAPQIQVMRWECAMRKCGFAMTCWLSPTGFWNDSIQDTPR